MLCVRWSTKVETLQLRQGYRAQEEQLLVQTKTMPMAIMQNSLGGNGKLEMN